MINSSSSNLALRLRVTGGGRSYTTGTESYADYNNLECDEISILSFDSQLNQVKENDVCVYACRNCCAILSVPSEMHNEADIKTLLEPIHEGIVNILLLRERSSTFVGDASQIGELEIIRQEKNFVILQISDESTLSNVLNLYTNISLQSKSSTIIPPCVSMEIKWIELLCEGFPYNQGERDIFQLLKEFIIQRNRHEHIMENVLSKLTKSNLRFLMYPTCTFCLRRVKNIQSIVGRSTNDFLISKSIRYVDWGGSTYLKSPASPKDSGSSNKSLSRTVHCLVCYLHSIYEAVDNHVEASQIEIHYWDRQGDAEKETVRRLGRCMDCEETENIWMCMICCYTGCGRYSAKHAEEHYRKSGQQHHLSLELTSGCIWDYSHDCFAHIEDPASLTHRGGPRRHTAAFPRQPPSTSNSAFYSSASSDSYQLNTIPDDGHQNSGGARRQNELVVETSREREFVWGASESKVEETSVHSQQAPSHAYFEEPTILKPFPSSSSHSSVPMYLGFANRLDDTIELDSSSASKMNQLMGEYDSLLRSQLLDQQLYFEKLLAKETVRALELSHQFQLQQENQKRGSSGVTLSDISEASSSLNLNMDDESLHRDLSDVEKIKMEISALEAEYKQVLDSVRAVDSEVRALKKSNDETVAAIKSHVKKISTSYKRNIKQQESLWSEKESVTRQETAQQVAELENQIRDLTFYSRTQSQMQYSPFKEEIQSGVVVTRTEISNKKQSSTTSTGKRSSKRK